MKKKETRNKIVNCRATEYQKNKIKQIASLYGMTVSDYLVEAGMKYKKRIKKTNDVYVREG